MLASLVFGFKQSTFVLRVLIGLFSTQWMAGFPWIGLGVLRGVLRRQGCAAAVKVVDVLIPPVTSLNPVVSAAVIARRVREGGIWDLTAVLAGGAGGLLILSIWGTTLLEVYCGEYGN